MYTAVKLQAYFCQFCTQQIFLWLKQAFVCQCGNLNYVPYIVEKVYGKLNDHLRLGSNSLQGGGGG